MSAPLAGKATPMLRVSGLTVTHAGATAPVLLAAALDVARGERVGITGPSGSGKSTFGAALLDVLPRGARRAPGARIEVDGEDLLALDDATRRARRGIAIGMAFQEPLLALTPTMAVGDLIAEGLVVHGLATPAEAARRAIEMLERVRIPEAHASSRRLPHELSGGMRQRALLASVMVLEPKVLVVDEPTTALDATVQEGILDLLDDLCAERGTALLHISHDLAVLAERCDRIVELRDGAFVPRPRPAPRTLAMARGIRITSTDDAPAPVPTPRQRAAVESRTLVIEALRVTHREGGGWGIGRPVEAVRGLSLKLAAGEARAVIGESGSGKSSLVQAIVGMARYEGSIVFDGREVSSLSGSELQKMRARIRIVPQEAGASLTPHMAVGELVAEGALEHAICGEEESRMRAASLLDQLGLPASAYRARPGELSAGQRQRVAIARALITGPEIIIADEPVSALDPESRLRVLGLFAAVRRAHRTSLLLVTHDLEGVIRITDAVTVMRDGSVVEAGLTPDVLLRPATPYTRELVNSVPTGDPGRIRNRRVRDAEHAG